MVTGPPSSEGEFERASVCLASVCAIIRQSDIPGASRRTSFASSSSLVSALLAFPTSGKYEANDDSTLLMVPLELPPSALELDNSGDGPADVVPELSDFLRWRPALPAADEGTS